MGYRLHTDKGTLLKGKGKRLLSGAFAGPGGYFINHCLNQSTAAGAVVLSPGS